MHHVDIVQGSGMKAVILAGGLGSRLSEETSLRPKPMVEVGGKPILWHIMRRYSRFGVNDFIVCLGYKGYVIKEYFANYFLHTADVTIDLSKNEIEVHRAAAEPWRVTLVETGESTMTGGRLARVIDRVSDEHAFFFTYGDGIADIDIQASLEHHRASGRLATMTAVQPPGRFGALELDGDRVLRFAEKPQGDGAWINGGFFVLSPEVKTYLQDDATVWEEGPLEGLARDGQLGVYRHSGFWQPMDTLRDRTQLEQLWSTGQAPWVQ